MREQEMLKLDEVNAVIRHHLFPQCTRDVTHGLHFDNWEFSGFVPDPSSTINLIATISAQYRGDGANHTTRAMIDVDVLAKSPTEIFRHIDAHLMGKINALVNDAIGDHHLL